MNIKFPSSEASFETQAVRIFRILEQEILRSKLKPGLRLVRRDLAQRFEVSQATITEALWRLESEGLAESAPMYGTRVAQITPERVRDETILREALECEVARLLARNLSTFNPAPLYELADRVDLMMNKPAAYAQEGMEAHQEFHIQLATLTGSFLLKREVERIWRRHCVFFHWVSAQVHPVPAHWHRLLLDAILTGDPDRAEQTMRKHVLYGSDFQKEVLGQMQTAKPTKKRSRKS